MPRSVNAVASKARRKKILKQANALVHPIIKAFRQQCRLLAIRPLNETFHHPPAIQQGNHSIGQVSTQSGPKADISSLERLPTITQRLPPDRRSQCEAQQNRQVWSEPPPRRPPGLFAWYCRRHRP